MSELRKKTSLKQTHLIVDCMEANLLMANGKFNTSDGRLTNEKAWEKLADKLNSGLGPVKTPAKWQQVWRDLKNNTKKKANRLRLERQKLGGDINSVLPLSRLDERILAIMGSEVVEEFNIPDTPPPSRMKNEVMELEFDLTENGGTLPSDHTSPTEATPRTPEFAVCNTEPTFSMPEPNDAIPISGTDVPTTASYSNGSPAKFPPTRKKCRELNEFESSMLRIQEGLLKCKRRKLELMERDMRNRQNFHNDILNILSNIYPQHRDEGEDS